MTKVVKPACKDTVDMRKAGGNKVAKFDQQLSKLGGQCIRQGGRGKLDGNRRP